jgi:capsular polysaccharide biosynthesis protein
LIHQIFAISPNNNLTKKLCLIKEKGNRWLNIEEYSSQIYGSGVQKIYPESLSLSEQVQLYKVCSDLIGEGGVLSNMLFLPKGSNVITGLKASQLTRTWFSSLAGIFGLNYHEIPEKLPYQIGHNTQRLSTYIT